MGSRQQRIYEALCEMSPAARNGLFLLMAVVLVSGSGFLWWQLIQFLFPVLETSVAFVTAGIMWLVWLIANLLLLLYLSLIFQGK